MKRERALQVVLVLVGLFYSLCGYILLTICGTLGGLAGIVTSCRCS
jgi:hypothetical protein